MVKFTHALIEPLKAISTCLWAQRQNKIYLGKVLSLREKIVIAYVKLKGITQKYDLKT